MALRLPAAYRVREGREGGWRDWKGAEDVGRDESGRKTVVVIRTDCRFIIGLNATKLTHAMQKQC